MRAGSVCGFDTNLRNCTKLSAKSGAREAIAEMQAAGAEFARIGTAEPYPDPYAAIGANGNVSLAMDFRHPALRTDRLTLDVLRFKGLPLDTAPWASFSFTQGGRSVAIRQDAQLDDRGMIDALALGQLLLACDLVPRLEPEYGWIDERGSNLPFDSDCKPLNLRFIFWANIFGPEHVAFLGRDFLKDAPGWRLVDLPNGGVIYVVSESYLEWWHEDRKDVLRYFRGRVPKIKQYRAKESGW